MFRCFIAGMGRWISAKDDKSSRVLSPNRVFQFLPSSISMGSGLERLLSWFPKRQPETALPQGPK